MNKIDLSRYFYLRVVLLCAIFILSAGTVSKASRIPIDSVSIRFEENSSKIDKAAIKIIREFSKKLKNWDVAQVLIEGHTDNRVIRGKSLYSDNQKLSQARANKILRLLLAESDLPAEKFKVIGWGSSKPVSTNNSEEGRAQNRRVEIKVLRKDDIALNSGTPSTKAKIQNQPLTSISFREVSIAEAFEMLSKKERVNIILEKGVTGKISLNLYEVTLDEAISAVAEAGGYEVARKHQGYFILSQDSEKNYKKAVETDIRTFGLQYANPDKVKEILSKYITKHGEVNALTKRKMIVIEDTLESLARLEKILAELDKKPYQILIEAKILEISLTDGEKFGVDWKSIFNINTDGSKDANLSFGTNALVNTSTGFLLNLTNVDVTGALGALSEKGRVLALSTPKLLTIENQEASVIIGDRQGYRVTTTIDQVTSESIEFLDSGVILRVTPSVDSQGRILMRIHPEVSSGTIQLGIPSQTTTSVTSELYTYSGKPIFIGGLIRNTTEYTRNGIPLLSEIPILGNLFSSTDEKVVSTETVVLITPHIVTETSDKNVLYQIQKVSTAEKKIKGTKVWTRELLDK